MTAQQPTTEAALSWLRDSWPDDPEAKAEFADLFVAIEAETRAGALDVETLTEGDVAKALVAAYSVLGYWPDPARIGGTWEVWGAALRAALLAEQEAMTRR